MLESSALEKRNWARVKVFVKTGEVIAIQKRREIDLEHLEKER